MNSFSGDCLACRRVCQTGRRLRDPARNVGWSTCGRRRVGMARTRPAAACPSRWSADRGLPSTSTSSWSGYSRRMAGDSTCPRAWNAHGQIGAPFPTPRLHRPGVFVLTQSDCGPFWWAGCVGHTDGGLTIIPGVGALGSVRDRAARSGGRSGRRRRSACSVWGVHPRHRGPAGRPGRHRTRRAGTFGARRRASHQSRQLFRLGRSRWAPVRREPALRVDLRHRTTKRRCPWNSAPDAGSASLNPQVGGPTPAIEDTFGDWCRPVLWAPLLQLASLTPPPGSGTSRAAKPTCVPSSRTFATKDARIGGSPAVAPKCQDGVRPGRSPRSALRRLPTGGAGWPRRRTAGWSGTSCG